MADHAASEVESFFSYNNLKSLSVMIVVILAIRSSIASPYHVPTPSMEPTIKVGDRLLAAKFSYNLRVPFTDYVLVEFGKVSRGDIIVFKYPKDPEIDYVKRVVAIGGDRIRLKDDIIYINDQAQSRQETPELKEILSDITDNPEKKTLYRENLSGLEHWVIENQPEFRPFSRGNWPSNIFEYTVPSDAVFVIGDNRDNSADSREWGEVPISYFLGKALFVLWSAYSPADSLLKIRWDRFGHWLDSFKLENVSETKAVQG